MSRSDRNSAVTWSTRRLLAWTTQYFAGKCIDHPRRAAETLLAQVLSVRRLDLYMDADRPASELERSAFRDLVERAAKHEPVEYLVGHAQFFCLDLQVSPAVLIPRPSTETIVEHVIQHCQHTPGFAGPLIADIGTGSGAVAIALAKHLDGCRVIATDISQEALDLACENARRHGVAERIDFRRGDLLEALPKDVRLRYLAANPPYISDAEWSDVPANVKDYEPQQALRAGADGLEFIRRLISGCLDYLARPGQLVLEIAASQGQEVLSLARQTPDLSNLNILADHEGLPRVLVADRA